jgi:hypothetical protein
LKRLSAGQHRVAVSTTDSYGGWIDKIAVVDGTVPWSEPVIGGPAAALHGRPPRPGNFLRASDTSVRIEAESLELVNGTICRVPPDGNSAVCLDRPAAYLCGLVSAEADMEWEVWCRTYFENKNIFESPVLQEYSQALYFSLDGLQAKTFYETDEKRWRWASLGKARLARGAHALLFHKRGMPITIDRLIFYRGAEPWNEDWYRQKDAHVLPFGLANEVPFDDARRAGDWRIFGSLATSCEGSCTGVRQADAESPIRIAIQGRGAGAVVLQKLRPVRTSESSARTRPEHQVSVWVKGDRSGASLSALVSDSSQETFCLSLAPKVDWDGWRLVSAAIPRKAGPEMLHEGGNGDGVVDYPVAAGFLVVERAGDSAVDLTLGELFFESPFQLRVESVETEGVVTERPDAKGKTIRDESEAKATVQLSVANRAEQSREALVYYRFVPLGAAYSPSQPEASLNPLTVRVPGRGAQAVTLSAYRFGRGAGVYAVDCALGATKPIRRLFGFREGAEAILKAERETQERKHGAGHFSPDGQDRPLVKPDGTPVPRQDVGRLYGTFPRFTVLVDGLDVTSRAYADRLDLRRRIRPEGADLSDAAGWPDIRVPAGVLAIDPALGRFKFCEGDADPMALAAYHITGFGVPGDSPAQLRHGRLFVCPGEGDLSVIDVTDPEHARIVGFGLAWYFYHRLYFYRNYAYFNSSLRNTILIWDDLSNPCRPGHIRSLNLDRNVYGHMMAVFENAGVAYTTTHILDLTDPLNPRPLRKHDVGELFFPEGRRYELSYRENRTRIAVFDLTDPLNPRIVAEMPADAPVGLPKPEPGTPAPPPPAPGGTPKPEPPKTYTIAAVGTDYFLLRLGDRLALYRNLVSPAFVATLDYAEEGPLYLSGFGFYKNRLIVVDGRKPPNQNYVWTPKYPHSRVSVYEIGKDSLQKIGSYEDPVQTNYNLLSIDERGYGYTTDMNFGVWVLDLRDGKNPRKVCGVPISSEIRGGVVGDRYALPGQYFGGTHLVIDVQDPVRPARRGYCWDGNYLGCWNLWQKKCASAGDVFYLPRSVSTAVVECSDPENPRENGELKDAQGNSTGPCDTIAQDGILYALGNKLFTYDVSDPAKPALLAELAGVPPGLLGLGRGVLVAVGRELCAIDVQDPKGPKVLARTESLYAGVRGPRGALASGYAYLIRDAEGSTSLDIFDLRKPEAMRKVRTARLLEDAEAAPWGDYYFGWLESSGDYLFAANYEGGLDCYDIRDRENPRFFGRLRNGMSWLVGEVKGDFLYEPTIQGLCVVDVPTTSQVPQGTVTTR